MKAYPYSWLVAIFGLSLLVAQAQPGGHGGMGGAPGGPNFSGSMSKLFGDNKSFSATLEILAKESTSGETTMPGKLVFDEGKTRFEMDMTQIKNAKMPAEAVAQMQAMGMDRMVVISRPDQKANFMVYPGLQAYTEMPAKDTETPEAVSKFKVESTELGKETVDGHTCVKNKVVVTDDKGKSNESTVWNATDLKKFPVKIETVEKGTTMTLSFKDVKLAKPDAKLFEAPAEFKKYENMMTMMQAEMMKRMGGAGGFAPPTR